MWDAFLWLKMSESFVSKDEKNEEDPQERWSREREMRREHEAQMEIERLRRGAREWERQQRINPAPNPLLMPLEPSNMSQEHSSDKIVETSSIGHMLDPVLWTIDKGWSGLHYDSYWESKYQQGSSTLLLLEYQ